MNDRSSTDPALNDQIHRAVQVVRDGGVIVFPTDTVYGLAAAIDRPAAIERVYAIKGRAETKPLPVLISRPDEIRRLASTVPAAATQLAMRFWPGPLTIVVPASERVPLDVRRGVATVGLRIPNSQVALRIIEGAGGALAVTSANRSGEPETTTADEVCASVGGLVDVVVDGGRTPGSTPSTVVDVSGATVTVLRHGVLSEALIRAALDARP